MSSLSPIQRFFHLLEPDRKDITYIYLYAIFGGLLTLTLPLGVQAVIGLVQGGEVSSSLVILIGIVTLGTLFTGLLKIMQLTVAETLQRRIFARSAFEFALRIPRLRMDALEKEYAPELVNRFFDTMTVQKGLPKILMDFSTGVVQIVFGLLLISFYHPFFVFFGIIVLLLLVLLLRWTGPKGLSTSLLESKYKYKVAHWLQEVARAMVTFKLASGARLSISKTDSLVNSYLDARGQHFKILVSQYGLIVAFKTMVTGVLLALGGVLVIDNQITIGQFVAAEIVVLLILGSVEKVILTLADVYDLLTGLEKIGYFTDLPLDPVEGSSFEKVDTGKGMAIMVKDLSFRFLDSEKQVLDKLSFSVEPGEKVCIAGYNGSGKSTLIQIVSGLRINFQGNVSYNGLPMQNFNLSSLRSFIGDHGAQEDIFQGTLWENICLGHEEVDFQQIIWATNQVGLEAFVQGLPKGYNTLLVPGGKNLPQSVQTKILLARSIVSQPRLLALEEFLHQLQPLEQQKMADMLTARHQPWTLLAVSNDPLLAARCERIILMQDGQIIAQGSYEMLRDNPHFEHIFQVNIPNGQAIQPDWPTTAKK
ncbi:MAG: xenobiotic-transporting ATPase [Bacteroidetes bacterium]|nr:MAG: xenobiotic-transporting ATPase [Bacteroidota bacterium]